MIPIVRTISPILSDADVLVELGRRLEEMRVRARIEIQDAAKQTGLSRRTIYRAELGDNPTLATLLRLLRLYGRLGELDQLLRPPEVSPMAIVLGKTTKPLAKRRRKGRTIGSDPQDQARGPETGPR